MPIEFNAHLCPFEATQLNLKYVKAWARLGAVRKVCAVLPLEVEHAEDTSESRLVGAQPRSIYEST